MGDRRPAERTVLGYMRSCSNWGRWGKDDQLGTMNYITDAKRRQAASLVKTGVSVTCARPITTEKGPDVMHAALHYMVRSGEKWAGKKTPPGGNQGASDFIGMVFHGMHVTHVDSLSHIFWDGKMYNGFSSDKVTTDEGATVESVDLLKNGIVTRGVLLDVPRHRKVKWLEPGEEVAPQELEAIERECGVRVEPGDVLLMRTGHVRKRTELGPWGLRFPGYRADCLPWFHERQVAMVGSDVIQDPMPTAYKQLAIPIHQIGIPFMGLWLLDNANLEDVAAACEKHKRWAFSLTIAPLRVVYGTGSPVNPIAVF
ncbi:MAG: cyclase family protein [Dehalococcoidia bacterium]|nr:cyclase family protein [Dehalococcoidia bacterium]